MQNCTKFSLKNGRFLVFKYHHFSLEHKARSVAVSLKKIALSEEKVAKKRIFWRFYFGAMARVSFGTVPARFSCQVTIFMFF